MRVGPIAGLPRSTMRLLLLFPLVWAGAVGEVMAQSELKAVLDAPAGSAFKSWENAYLMAEGNPEAKVVGSVQRGTRLAVKPERSNEQYYWVRVDGTPQGTLEGYVWRDFVQVEGQPASAVPAIIPPLPEDREANPSPTASAPAASAPPMQVETSPEASPRPTLAVVPTSVKEREKETSRSVGKAQKAGPAPSKKQPEDTLMDELDEQGAWPGTPVSTRAAPEAPARDLTSEGTFGAPPRQIKAPTRERRTEPQALQTAKPDAVELARQKIKAMRDKRSGKPVTNTSVAAPAKTAESRESARPAPARVPARPVLEHGGSAQEPNLAMEELRSLRHRLEKELESVPHEQLSGASAARVDRQVALLDQILAKERELSRQIEGATRRIDDHEKAIEDLRQSVDALGGQPDTASQGRLGEQVQLLKKSVLDLTALITHTRNQGRRLEAAPQAGRPPGGTANRAAVDEPSGHLASVHGVQVVAAPGAGSADDVHRLEQKLATLEGRMDVSIASLQAKIDETRGAPAAPGDPPSDQRDTELKQRLKNLRDRVDEKFSRMEEQFDRKLSKLEERIEQLQESLAKLEGKGVSAARPAGSTSVQSTAEAPRKSLTRTSEPVDGPRAEHQPERRITPASPPEPDVEAATKGAAILASEIRRMRSAHQKKAPAGAESAEMDDAKAQTSASEESARAKRKLTRERPLTIFEIERLMGARLD